MTRASHKLDGLPNDLLTSDIENERRLKVEASSQSDDINLKIENITREMKVYNSAVLLELKLMNARLEASLDTSITYKDL